MSKLTCFIQKFIDDESGLTAVEYAIAGGLVVGGMVGAFLTLGSNATLQINELACASAGQTYDAGSAETFTDDVGNDDAVAASCG